MIKDILEAMVFMQISEQDYDLHKPNTAEGKAWREGFVYAHSELIEAFDKKTLERLERKRDFKYKIKSIFKKNKKFELSPEEKAEQPF